MNKSSSLLKLLLIENSSVNNGALEMYANQGTGSIYVDVRKVANAKEASALMASWKPSALIMDVKTEDNNRDDILAIYGSDNKTPVIVTSEELDYELAGNMIAKGASAVIKKPVDSASFEFLIQNVKELSDEFGLVQ